MKNILIVEDDSFAREFYRLFFEKAGYSALITDDPEVIFSSLESKKIGLIIMDINLKNTYFDGELIDGMILSSNIKKRYGGIPVLLVTASVNKNAEKGALQKSYADGVVSKPITDFNGFLQTVNRMFIN